MHPTSGNTFSKLTLLTSVLLTLTLASPAAAGGWAFRRAPSEAYSQKTQETVDAIKSHVRARDWTRARKQLDQALSTSEDSQVSAFTSVRLRVARHEAWTASKIQVKATARRVLIATAPTWGAAGLGAFFGWTTGANPVEAAKIGATIGGAINVVTAGYIGLFDQDLARRLLR